MFTLLTFTGPDGVVRHVWVDGDASSDALIQALGRLQESGVQAGQIQIRGTFASPSAITGDERFSGATSITDYLNTLAGGGGDGGGDGGTDPEELPFDFEGAFPGAAFQRGLTERTGRTGQATNLLQRILGAEAGQTQSAFRGSAIADLLGGTGIGEVLGRSFQDFTAGTGRAARSNLAQDIFRRIGARGGNIESFLGNEALGDAPREFLRPTSVGAAGDAVNLLRDALRGTVNPLLLGALPSTTQLFDQFRADPNIGLAPTGGNNIIDFLRRRFRTGQLGF